MYSCLFVSLFVWGLIDFDVRRSISQFSPREYERVTCMTSSQLVGFWLGVFCEPSVTYSQCCDVDGQVCVAI